MEPKKPKYVLHCGECGSRRFEVHGPTMEGTAVHCAECGARAGDLNDLVTIVEDRAEKSEDERRKRRSH